VPFVRHWLHVGLVGLDGVKMSKSLGNLLFVGELCKEWEPMAIRLALLSHHYRHDWSWSPDDLPVAAERLALWRAAAERGPSGGEPALDAARRHLDDDLDAPGALHAIDEQARLGRGVGAAAALLGVTL
jgi:L-cysteine:1D-myo-inositol 2-amino-2-deoxy-alpha-D-glucopyranoside ligase